MAEILLTRPTAAERFASRPVLAPLAVAVAATGFVALCAHASIPLLFTPVPLSLAPFAVIFLGLLLGPQVAFASLCIYLLEGAAGLPVFSPQGAGGIAQLLGPTGGYLLSYPFAAALTGYLYRIPARNGRVPRSFPLGLLAAGGGSAIILVAGASWLKLLTHMDLQLILAQAVVPFLPGDVLKVCVAAGAMKLIGRFRKATPPRQSYPGKNTL